MNNPLGYSGAFPSDKGADGGKDPADGIQQAGSGITSALSTVAGIINDITAILTTSKENMARTIGGILDKFIPAGGGIFGAVGGLISALNKKKPITVDKILDPVRTLPASLSIFGAANPATRAYGGRLSVAGVAAARVEISLKGTAGRMFHAEVSRYDADFEDLGGW